MLDGTSSPLSLIKAGTGKLTLTFATSTYTGTTTISGGTISVGSLAASGTASGIGKGFITLDGGVLQYTGTATAALQQIAKSRSPPTAEASTPPAPARSHSPPVVSRCPARAAGR